MPARPPRSDTGHRCHADDRSPASTLQHGACTMFDRKEGADKIDPQHAGEQRLVLIEQATGPAVYSRIGDEDVETLMALYCRRDHLGDIGLDPGIPWPGHHVSMVDRSLLGRAGDVSNDDERALSRQPSCRRAPDS